MSPKQRAAAIRRLRRERSWTMKQVAELFSRDIATVSRWECNRHAPPQADQIAHAFGITEDEVSALCERCAYSPPAGYMCLTCGMKGN